MFAIFHCFSSNWRSYFVITEMPVMKMAGVNAEKKGAFP